MSCSEIALLGSNFRRQERKLYRNIYCCIRIVRGKAQGPGLGPGPMAAPIGARLDLGRGRGRGRAPGLGAHLA